MSEINTVTVLGANGNVGSKCAAIIAGFGNVTVHMLARNIDKAEHGIQKAIQSIRSDAIKKQLIAGTYESNLKYAVENSDWVFEAVAEDFDTKFDLFAQVSTHLGSQTIVSSGTSGFSITSLSKALKSDAHNRFFGTHFFSPPYKMILCEFIKTSDSDPAIAKSLQSFLEQKLHRQVVHVKDEPAFAGNRVGFLVLNLACQLAEEYKALGGIPFIDEILGGFTGRVMPPLRTVDLVGLDIHKAIVENLCNKLPENERDFFMLPDFMQHLINIDRLGVKSGKGLYNYQTLSAGESGEKYYFDISTNKYLPVAAIDLEFVKQANNYIANSDYQKAVNIICNAKGSAGEICRYIIANYISYAFSLVGQVVDDVESIDKIMSFGFNWVPPSAWVDLLGGHEATIDFLENAKVKVPSLLRSDIIHSPFYQLNNLFDPRCLFRAKVYRS
ncbi:MAG: 3-hydroxyacyl-CoA dehydrogenase family protein [Candidatus Electrothrix sp. AR3]|nr:3-hydroxyacyl-CoA dehydrogenase family protein [Candidatus Electrothrix sp. AR3]